MPCGNGRGVCIGISSLATTPRFRVKRSELFTIAPPRISSSRALKASGSMLLIAATAQKPELA